MNILIHASLDFAEDMIFAKEYIEKTSKFKVLLPDLKRYQHIRDDYGDDVTFTKIKNRLTTENIKQVERCDCLLIINKTHRGIANYVGGNSFMEMVVAFYLKKPIYLLNPIPENMSYTEEIKSFYPIITNNLNMFVEIIAKSLDSK